MGLSHVFFSPARVVRLSCPESTQRSSSTVPEEEAERPYGRGE